MILTPSPREPTPGERRRTCFRCVHADITAHATFCIRYSELVDSELYAARNCESYQEPSE